MTYTTYDYLPDLTASEMIGARTLNFKPASNGGQYESEAIFATTEKYAILRDTFKFTGIAGASYAVISSSFFDPFIAMVYDNLGNVINYDSGGGTYGYDYVTFVAPYSGTYYASASWDQGSAAAHQAVAIGVFQDVDTIPVRGNNFQQGTSGNDIFRATEKNDTFSGGDGFDQLRFPNPRSDYSITKNGEVVTIVDKTGYGGTDQANGVEGFLFAGSAVSFQTTGIAAEVYRLYRAAFDRTSDKDGIGYWVVAMQNGTPLRTVADAFMSSSEFAGLYGASPTNDQVLTALYRNVLHRAPDSAGYDFWMGALAAGAVTVPSMLMAFSESQENQTQVIGAINLGIEFTYFT